MMIPLLLRIPKGGMQAKRGNCIVVRIIVVIIGSSLGQTSPRVPLLNEHDFIVGEAIKIEPFVLGIRGYEVILTGPIGVVEDERP